MQIKYVNGKKISNKNNMQIHCEAQGAEDKNGGKERRMRRAPRLCRRLYDVRTRARTPRGAVQLEGRSRNPPRIPASAQRNAGCETLDLRARRKLPERAKKRSRACAAPPFA